MSVHDALPNDIYVDSTGKLWRCVLVCHEPTVTFEEVEGRVEGPYQYAGVAILNQNPVVAAHSPTPQIIRSRQSGGVGGLMWTGWKRIFRKETA